ncbi:hypothetical protein HYFRA_00008217 [Hymenoscyphus fraxineus]|uniref:UV excision repair protein RAD23 n=1 Tax=Hymenoscyphus fraxineus TaxID=746836 RepID=A0A9N9LAG2_9HELO|nr:hypothetical protein HYFRA_00008217 [Hymenoscyphus fraxineus]
MKLTFKDLKQHKFEIEADPSELVSPISLRPSFHPPSQLWIGDVKAKIAKEKGWEASTLKLIYSGKILQDTNTVESYKIEEKGFTVCMITKPKPVPVAAASPAKAPSTPAPAVASTPAPPAAPIAQPNLSGGNAIPATPSPAGSGANAASQATPSAASSGGLAMGAERAAQIAEMESMGFERSQIDLAMRAAFYNSERAIEYLLTGIPESAQPEQRPAAPAPGAQSPPAAAAAAVAQGDDEPINLFEAAQAAGRGGAGAGAGAGAGLFGGDMGAGAAGGLGNLDFLRNNPQFQQLRQVVQQNPQMLEPILQQVSAGNPQLAQLISHHQEEFLQLLSEGGGDNDAPLPPGAQTISVTEEEREAIERLTHLGFSRDQAIQAYFACDKNEELAANFLFEQPEDEE